MMKKYTVKHQKNENYGWEGDLLENQVAREGDAEDQGHTSITFPLRTGDTSFPDQTVKA